MLVACYTATGETSSSATSRTPYAAYVKKKKL